MQFRVPETWVFLQLLLIKALLGKVGIAWTLYVTAGVEQTAHKPIRPLSYSVSPNLLP